MLFGVFTLAPLKRSRSYGHLSPFFGSSTLLISISCEKKRLPKVFSLFHNSFSYLRHLPNDNLSSSLFTLLGKKPSSLVVRCSLGLNGFTMNSSQPAIPVFSRFSSSDIHLYNTTYCKFLLEMIF